MKESAYYPQALVGQPMAPQNEAEEIEKDIATGPARIEITKGSNAYILFVGYNRAPSKTLAFNERDALFEALRGFIKEP
jgi:hypothetical protein